jgi:hypothetical protein
MTMSDLIKREYVMALWEKYNPYIAVKAIEFGNALKEIPCAVPTPHGNLVDIDAMIDRFWDGDHMEIYCRDLDDIPVIVEAEAKHE